MNALPCATIETYTDRELWLARRREGIGSSDAAAVLGESLYSDALAVYLDKRGEHSPKVENDYVFWGNLLEPVVADGFAIKTGRKVGKIASKGQSIAVNNERPWQFATPDFVLDYGDGGEAGLLEIKTTKGRNRELWQEDAPVYYQVQLQHQFAATGLRRGTLACLIDTSELVYYDYEANADFIAAMNQYEREFWALVEAGTPPQPTGQTPINAWRHFIGAERPGVCVDLPAIVDEYAARLDELAETIKAAESEKNELRKQIEMLIGAAEYGITPSGLGFSYKTTEIPPKTVDGYSFRCLRKSQKGLKVRKANEGRSKV